MICSTDECQQVCFVRCSNEQHLEVETLNLTLLVRESEPIEVVLNGSNFVSVDEAQLSTGGGELICPNLTITARVKSYQNKEAESQQVMADDVH